MKATEVHDLLRDVRAFLRQHVTVWHFGEGQFSHIEYCCCCSYSKSHGHGENCIFPRLDSANNPEAK